MMQNHVMESTGSHATPLMVGVVPDLGASLAVLIGGK